MLEILVEHGGFEMTLDSFGLVNDGVIREPFE
jgi:hypothetical protein